MSGTGGVPPGVSLRSGALTPAQMPDEALLDTESVEVTGNRADAESALKNLLTVLAAQGIIVDSTTAT